MTESGKVEVVDIKFGNKTYENVSVKHLKPTDEASHSHKRTSKELGVKKKKKKEDLPRYRQPIYDDPEIKGRGRAPLPADSEDPRLRALKKMGIDPRMKKKDGGAFPDLSGDGKVTQKDILIGRGVIKKKMGGIARGGGAAIQGTGFKGVY